MFTLLLAAVQLSTAAPPTAPETFGFYTVAELAGRCLPGPQANASYCFAYVTGVHDTVRAFELWHQYREFCVPEGTPQADLRSAVVDYLGAHEADGTAQAASVVVIALRQRYPCSDTPATPG